MMAIKYKLNLQGMQKITDWLCNNANDPAKHEEGMYALALEDYANPSNNGSVFLCLDDDECIDPDDVCHLDGDHFDWVHCEDNHDSPIHYALLMLHAMGLPDPHLSNTASDEPILAITVNDESIFNPYKSSCGRFEAMPSQYGITEKQANALCKANEALGFDYVI